MKRGSVLCLGFSVALCANLFSYGCSSSSGSSPGPDAGKRDSAAAKGGSTPTGGSSSAGGSSGSGGSNAAGGSSSSGGSNASGGASASGGSSAAGGSSGGVGGETSAGGSTGVGGSTSTGGSTAGTGGTFDGGTPDAAGSDAIDAPLINVDGSDVSDTGASTDGGPMLVDLGSIDTQIVDMVGVDLGLVLLDAGEDGSIDSPADASPVDTSGIDAGTCIAQIVSSGYSAGGHACSTCSENGTSLETKCNAMIDCLGSAWPCTDNCRTNCGNTAQADGVAQACVAEIVTAACGSGF